MKRFALLLLLLFAFCKSPQPGTSRTSSIPGHGAISIQVIPNPIVAQHVSGSTYDFPFDVDVRETGGRSVTISRVSATVYGPAGVQLGSESWDAARINAAGYSTNLPGNGELRYHFNPRQRFRMTRCSTARVRRSASTRTTRPGLRQARRRW